MAEEKYMKIAIEQAKKALESGEGMAFGAVIVKDDKVLSKGHNTVLSDQDPINHAETNVIRAACKKLKTKDLSGCTLYSTCEPCPMCFVAAWWANISKIIYGVNLEDVTDVNKEILVSCKYLNEKGNSKVNIQGGFLKKECLELYK